MPRSDAVYGRYRPLKFIRMADCIAMYRLFIQQYDNTSLDTFLRDMTRKTGVLVIYRKCDDSIVGFSTVTTFQMKVDGQAVRCVFNGDTVLDRRYRDSGALHVSGLLYLWRQKLLHPFTPVYWYLISMGYGNYLTMVKHFPRHYPDLHGDDPHLHNIAMAASERLFPGALDRSRAVLDFGEDACQLKSHVAPISETERSDEHIAFFEQRNPHWMRGDEMPCLGAIDLGMIWRLLKQGAHRLFQWEAKTHAVPQTAQHAVEAAPANKR